MSWDTLPLNWDFLPLNGLKRRENRFSSPISSMQCSADVRATYLKKQTPQLCMEGTGEGCGFLCSLKVPCLSTMSQQFCRRLKVRDVSISAPWCYPGYYRQTLFLLLELCWKMFSKQRLCAVFGFQEWHINRWSVQFSLCGLQNQSSRRTHSG